MPVKTIAWCQGLLGDLVSTFQRGSLTLLSSEDETRNGADPTPSDVTGRNGEPRRRSSRVAQNIPHKLKYPILRKAINRLSVLSRQCMPEHPRRPRMEQFGLSTT